ncbi:hypothetical protein PG993_006206 [Apiospora rasikravindrae]|uniref:Methyltransferase domain-containing protein n=1 Tax=Apiospora rasikravindrae TaxID=990691 RepID=A0ABR1T520_9PEZI
MSTTTVTTITMGSIQEPSLDSRIPEAEKIKILLNSTLYDESLRDLAYIPRFQHRLSILRAWSIPAGSRILDIGCGQGESTLALALELGERARVTGIDTALPDYGTPYTVSQAQAHSLRSVLGPRIEFHRQDPATHLLPPPEKESGDPQQVIVHPTTPKYDAAVLCHSIWYFPDHATVTELFQTLARAGIPRLYLAEYDYSGPLPAQQPHILAARSQALFHASKTPRAAGRFTLNIRAAPAAAAVLEAARGAGFQVVREGVVVPDLGMLEGHFEARYTQGDKYAARVRAEGLAPGQEEAILAYAPRIREKLEALKEAGVEKAMVMDTRWFEFELQKGGTVDSF